MSSSQQLLILDLDETLIYATETRLAREPDFVVGLYSVYKRPGLAEFLSFCLANFEVAVWTSSGAVYAKSIVETIFSHPEQLKFVWSRSRCTQRFNPFLYEHYFIKNLSKIKRKGYSLQKTLVIDDSPEKHEKNYGNLIRVNAYFGEENDHELESLSYYLLQLKDADNVRTLEKRGWQRKFGTRQDN